MNRATRGNSRFLRFLGVAGAAVAAPTPVLAHHLMNGEPPHSVVEGILSGVVHPILGLDHLLFLVVAGTLAYALQPAGRAAVASAFVVGGLLGSALHVRATGLPAVEAMVALSIILGGAIVLSQQRFGAARLSLFFGAAAILHGYAFAGPVVDAVAAPMWGYLAGLVVTQFAAIMAIPAVLGRIAAASMRRGDPVERIAGAYLFERIAGAAALTVGALLLALNLG